MIKQPNKINVIGLIIFDNKIFHQGLPGSTGKALSPYFLR
jgi:hypothetical protein